MRRMSEFERCLRERRLIKAEPDPRAIRKELETAGYDLASAEESLADDDFKWASVQAYYSMFHASKALVLKKGYREKSHACLLIALRELYVKAKELDKRYADDLELCMDMRHEADYAMTYDEESARIAARKASGFLAQAKEILG